MPWLYWYRTRHDSFPLRAFQKHRVSLRFAAASCCVLLRLLKKGGLAIPQRLRALLLTHMPRQTFKLHFVTLQLAPKTHNVVLVPSHLPGPRLLSSSMAKCQPISPVNQFVANASGPAVSPETLGKSPGLVSFHLISLRRHPGHRYSAMISDWLLRKHAAPLR